MTAPTRDVLLTCPLDCPDACRLRITLERGEDGRERAVKLTGDADHPYTRGFACAKTVHYPERQNHPERPLSPLRRVNAKSDPEPQWERVSWDEALDDIAARLRALIAERGARSILPYHYAGTMGLMEGSHVHALWRALGAAELEETICASAGTEAWTLGYGSRLGVDPLDVPRARLIVLWGINSLSTHSHLTPQITAARKAGARVVCVDPYRGRTAAFADTHLKIRAGTDTALALGVMHELFAHGWTDEAYLAEATLGAGELRAEAELWPPERVAEVTGLAADEVREFARAIGTTRPAYFRVGYGMTRHENGGTALRAVTLLPALTGDWRHRGGGCNLSTSGAFKLSRTRLGAAHRTRPDAPRVNMNELADALKPEAGFGALFVYNCNPAVVAPDSERVRAGMRRGDLLVVVLEQVMTESAQLADYVLPATTFMEHPDLYTSYGHHWLGYNPPALEAPGEARPNSWVFQELARRLGVEEPSVYWSVDELTAELLDTDHPFLDGITPERLRAEGSVRLNLPDEFLPYAHGAETPSGQVQLAPAPRYVPVQAALNAEYPLRLLTPPAHHFLNSTYGVLERLNRAEGGEPQLLLHPDDARQAGVEDGALARVQSEVGEIVRRVRVSDVGQPGLAVLEGTWWGLSAPDGRSVNALTAQTLTDLGGGSTFHNTRVRLVPLELGEAG
ncbi:Anaerobic selenocysteine-containing dehydrogenase [Deinococcus reticulitermitis]|uniref:Anaerobic selenocysteine-containing dehydrogenase n=1 Tax=Deinococcus reticulitermitis TaxID=856736 RepID=A0A1H6UBD9_9DEIO|nr:molybdopterin oxidoreductase family protein [Deinococcus reticulitermitis]SEI85162.1 Anaerobic selenocysteine-containing dehydrogenase [Deinococcus reticulitermitis]